MKITKVLLLLAATFFLAAGSSQAGISFTVGKGDFYLSVGDYDYLPYSDYNYPSYGAPRIRFYDVMSDYGTWVYFSPFGRVWRPYVSYDWRPYVYGHWVYTRYGPTWQGYEPWAWAGYHYGNWIFTQRFGWVWIPGYQWHPGRVVWSFGYGTIGWMPAPPSGYDYYNGYLNRYREDYGYGYDPYGYDSGYYSSRYAGVAPHLWIFININHFGHDNYSSYYLDRDYVRYMFDRRIVRVHRNSLQRDTIERIVKHKVAEVPVVEKQFDTDRERIKVVIPQGEEEKIRRHANVVVREAIAPGFAEKQKSFKGLQSKNQKVVSRVFRQENAKPVVESINSDVLVKKVQEEKKQKEVRRQENVRSQLDEVKRGEREGKVQEWNRNIERETGVKEGDRQKKERPEQKGADQPRKKDDQFDSKNKEAKPGRIEPYKPREQEKQDREKQDRSESQRRLEDEATKERGGSVKRKEADEQEPEIEEDSESKSTDSDSKETSKSKSKTTKKKKPTKGSEVEEESKKDKEKGKPNKD